MSVPLLYYGSPEPLPPRRQLQAGSLTAIYEAGDLRYVKIGDIEVCRRWYAAVRDRNWGTVPGVISDEVIEQTADGFRITYTSTHHDGDVHFVWRATIEACSQGSIASTDSPEPAGPVAVRFTFDGEAKATFDRNRIGFCILHPVRETAGAPVTLSRDDCGTWTASFPETIAPTNPFRDFDRMEIAHADGTVVEWQFRGDRFETEDQRNWIDASFKTFCTPLSEPFPVAVPSGTVVKQVAALRVRPQPPSLPRIHPAASGLRVGSRVAVLPAIGLTRASPLAALDVLRWLRPAHFRVELDLARPDIADRLRLAAAEASTFDAKIELAVTVSDDAWNETRRLIDTLHAVQPPLARVMAFHTTEWWTPERIVRPMREALARYDATVPVYAGTAANFTELNRNRAVATFADGVCYSVQPQEHAFDNASLVECCATIADTVRTARSFCDGKPLSVGPITLRKRVNPYATGPWEPPPPDPRYGSLFGAVWTLGALKYLAESGVASVTFFESDGSRGVMNGGRVFPLFHVLADAAEWAGAAVVQCESPDPLTHDALMLQAGDRTRVMVANMTAEPRLVTVDGLPPTVRVRSLDETTAEFASTDPVAFRRHPGDTLPTIGGRLSLSLRPYAYVRIDD